MSLAGRTALVTGASSGIGRAIALALAREEAIVWIVGRDPAKLAQTASAAKQPFAIKQFTTDLAREDNVSALVNHFRDEARLDILVHSVGTIQLGLMHQARIADLDSQFATNVRAPYLLTQKFLPLLTRAHGQVVFINSSAGLNAKRPEVGQYSATKHALKAIADSFREEVNSKGVRVLSVYAGRTATPMQEAIFRSEGRQYNPGALLQPEDIAIIVLQCLMLPPTAEVTDLNIRPMQRLV